MTTVELLSPESQPADYIRIINAMQAEMAALKATLKDGKEGKELSKWRSLSNVPHFTGDDK